MFDANPANGGRLDANAACPTLNEDPQIRSLVAEKDAHDSAKVAELVAKGVKPVRVMYADGGQHPDFIGKVDELSRPDAVAAGPVEIAMDDGRGKKTAPLKTALARAPAKPLATETVAARTEEEPAAVPVSTAALAPVAASPTDGIGRWLGLNKDAKAEPAPVAAQTPAATTPATILVTDPDKAAAKPRRASAPAQKPQASLDLTRRQ